MARLQHHVTALLLLTLAATGACKQTDAPPPSEPAEDKPATVEDLDWKQRVAIKSDEVQRKDPGQHQQLLELQSKKDAAGVPSLEGPLVENNPDAAPVLVTRMLDGKESNQNKEAIAYALPRTGGDWSEAAAALIPLEADPRVRKALVESMRYAEDPHGVEGLRHGFKDEEAEIRAAAARTAGFNPSGRMLYNELLSGLFAEDWDMRAASAQSLGKLEMKEAESALRRSLADEHEQVRLYSLLALEKISPDNVGGFPEVAKLRSDPSEPVASEANRISKR
ncbi:MAG: HEAT repeat domain-containing protein [Myxococcales bacterium]|nr:HEAT repeat domain-containing protein [Myxococcales bacterium]MCB9753863.1 HEAT repeat domain-containing protein [Myxococcales bacterium]